MTSCLAIDIGGTKIAAALVRDGIISDRNQIKTPNSSDQSIMDNALKQIISPLLKQADYLAIASTGIIDHGILKALNPDNLGGLNLYPLKTNIENITQLPVFVLNDAQAAAWAEYQQSKLINNMAFITISTGVGAGIIIDKQLLTGPRGVAGHAGHSLADPTGPKCGCGRQGCVESIASGTAIGKAGQFYFGEQCTAKFVFEKFHHGDLDAKKIIDKSAKVIANLIADLTICLDLEQVKLGGSVGLATGYIELVEQYLQTMPQAHQCSLAPAQCAQDAGLVGVACWAKSLMS